MRMHVHVIYYVFINEFRSFSAEKKHHRVHSSQQVLWHVTARFVCVRLRLHIINANRSNKNVVVVVRPLVRSSAIPPYEMLHSQHCSV